MTVPVIAIDGPSASGKGSIARGLARELGFAHLETGLLYRFIGKQWLFARKDIHDLAIAERIAQKFAQHFTMDLIDDSSLRTNPVAEAASITSAHPPVRAALLELQRNFAAHPPGEAKGAILDGRDIATIVCPDASVKIFVTASLEIRAERRRKELQSRGDIVTPDQVLQEVRARDLRDTMRETAPLIAVAGSFTVDTSDLDPAQAIEKALQIVRQAIPDLTSK